ncbi:MAG: hypothetical protein Q9163_001377 [Psora crenata]
MAKRKRKEEHKEQNEHHKRVKTDDSANVQSAPNRAGYSSERRKRREKGKPLEERQNKTQQEPAKKEKSVIRREQRDRERVDGPSPPTANAVEPSWTVSGPTGGQMLDIDPIFSEDEEYLLIAYHSYIAVYSTSSSLMVRRLQLAGSDRVTAMTLCPSKKGQLFVATASGRIELWNWLEGVKLTYWKFKGKPHSLTAIRQSDAQHQDIVFITGQNSDNSWQLSAHVAPEAEGHRARQNHTLFSQQQPLLSIRVVDEGRVIVMSFGPQLTIGTCRNPGVMNLSDLDYTWRTVTCPEWITSLDIRVIHDSKQRTKSKGPLALAPIDVVIGGLKGSIHIYEDILKRLVDCEKSSQKGQSQELTSRRLHWHRSAVLTVKWSSDGNYVISGGKETVLVLWQLDSGRKETLPHLGAPVESVVVSPAGSSYGIRLADNSAMILSTSEMRPSFSVAGIQIPGKHHVQNPVPLLPSVENIHPTNQQQRESRPPTCIIPSRPGQLLFAVPPNTSSRITGAVKQNASYLQTYDVQTAHQISRQALTRTKVTTLNMGPGSNTIEEPNITHIASSHDGQWLASVDEWMPPRNDVASLAFDRQKEREEQIFRQEIHLRFWSWNGDTKFWELVSRIDNPHESDTGNAYEGGRILALAANPSSWGFATFGEDGTLKTWRPTIRRRNGLDVKGKAGKALTNWSSLWSTFIGSPDHSAGDDWRPNAHIAYSPDSSVIAAGLQTPSASPLYLIDSYTGQIQSVQTGLYTGPLLGLGILDRYLIILSGALISWDLVNDELYYGIDLQLPKLSLAKLAAFSHLAVNMQCNTFAVTVPEITSVRRERKTTSRFAVFDHVEPDPLFVGSLPNTLTAILTAAERKGYYTIDSAAEVRTLTPGQSLPLIPREVPKLEDAPRLGLKAIFGNGTQVKDGKLDYLSEAMEAVVHEPEPDRNGRGIVHQKNLAEIFGQAPAYALPPVTELFEQVAGLFIGREMSTISRLRPIPSFPPYTGPYNVGTQDIEIPISNLSSLTPAPDPKVSSINFRLFYPCEQEQAKRARPVYWLPEPQGEYGRAYARFLQAGPWLASLLSCVPIFRVIHYTTIPAQRDAKPLQPPSKNNGGWPVMIFSHGLGGSKNAYSHLCGSMASHGVVVVAPDHRDGSTPISFIKDSPGNHGEPVHYKKIPHIPTPEVEEARDQQLKIRCWELGLVHDALVRMNHGDKITNTQAVALSDSQPAAFQSLLDLGTPGRISWSGHSFGAATMVQFVKSVYYGGSSLYTAPHGSPLSQQITPSSPIALLDLWTLPLESRSTSSLWAKPLPAYSSSASEIRQPPSPPLAILSEGFYKWTSNLTATLKAVSPYSSDARTKQTIKPNIFYPLSSAHLSQSDFGLLFSWITKKFLKVEEPERTMRLNVRAILESLRRCSITVADTSELDLEIQDDEAGQVPRFGGEDEGAVGQDHKILARDGSVRGWIAIDPEDEDRRMTTEGNRKNGPAQHGHAKEPQGPDEAVIQGELLKE